MGKQTTKPTSTRVTVQCSGCGCDIQRLLIHANKGYMWCDDCRRERQREKDREYYERKEGPRRRAARRERGLLPRGHPSKLTVQDVQDIRVLRAEGIPRSIIAEAYGLCVKTISEVTHRDLKHYADG